MAKKTILGEWFVQMEKVPTYRKMSALENGKLTLHPISLMQRKWAEAIKIRLNADGFDNVQILN